MRAEHAFILSSRFEGFGLVLVEALSTGSRVIAADCDYGPAEVLEGGRYGTLVPVEDGPALAKAILSSITQPDTLERPSAEWVQKLDTIEAERQHNSESEGRRGGKEW